MGILMEAMVILMEEDIIDAGIDQRRYYLVKVFVPWVVNLLRIYVEFFAYPTAQVLNEIK